ncbi:MAG: RidA family protein [Lentisphaeria bacterium]|nr:RidA family protein [Lentisphaeria bacterium]
MKRQIISTSAAPAAVGAYSQGVLIDGTTLYTSGQIGLVPATGEFAAADTVGQTRQVMQNLQALLDAAGMSFDDVVKTTCFLADINDFARFNAIYAEYFTGKPARSCVACAALPKGARVEVELIAVKSAE